GGPQSGVLDQRCEPFCRQRLETLLYQVVPLPAVSAPVHADAPTSSANALCLFAAPESSSQRPISQCESPGRVGPSNDGSVTKRLLFLCYARSSEEQWRELCIMDYELRIVVEKVAVSSEEVVQRDTITSYALQCPTSIGELGLRHAEQIALLEQVQNIVLAEQSVLLDLGTHVCPACGNPLKKNGYKASNFHAVFSDHTVRIQKHHCSHPGCPWHSTPTITSLFGTNIHPDFATLH